MILTMADGILAQANINIIKVKVIIILFSLYDVDCCCSGDVIVEGVLDDLVIKTSLSSPLVISLIVVVLKLQGGLIDKSAQLVHLCKIMTKGQIFKYLGAGAYVIDFQTKSVLALNKKLKPIHFQFFI